MNKAKQRPKTTANKVAKRSKAGAKKSITRAEARRLAARHVMERMFNGAVVKDSPAARLGGMISCGISRMAGVWEVYPNIELTGFGPSQVVVVCKRTGRVLYEGSAGDEG